MQELSGTRLEDFGKEVFERLGVRCFHRLQHARLIQIDPSGSYSNNEHLEFDYLIPLDRICIIGEITSRHQSRDLERKYQRYRRHYNILAARPFEDRVWRLLGVPEQHISRFRNVEALRGFYISTALQKYDVSLPEVPNIARFYKSDWESLCEYSSSIGKYAEHHFLSLFDVPLRRGRRPLEITATRTRDRKVLSGRVGSADVYTFEASPYELLPLSRVYRSDTLPDLSPASGSKYQRALIPDKLDKIRRTVLTEPTFMFPGSILVVLSSGCEYRPEQRTLLIPEMYGSVEVIDGQHRLFSYADEEVEARCSDCRIMVTGIQFHEQDQNAASRYSAKTFIEINTNQTTVRRSHVDAIRYPLLGETTPRALAAQIIWQANETNGAVYGLFKTNQTSLGVIPTTTVLTSLKALTSLEAIGKLGNVTRTAGRRRRQGYENLFGETIERLVEPEELIKKGKICFIRYFNTVADVFRHDWPKRERTNPSSLAFAKVMAAFVKLLARFVAEGLDWPDVKVQLETIRTNVMQLRSMRRYDDVLFDPDEPSIPDARQSPAYAYRFLDRNRTSATPIGDV